MPIDANIDLYACGESTAGEKQREREGERRSKSLFGIARMNIYDGTNAHARPRVADGEKDVAKIDDEILDHGFRCEEEGGMRNSNL